MKVTSYEISKRLAEIGFKVESEFFWVRFINKDESLGIAELFHKNQRDGVSPYCIKYLTYLTYDLETILEALPKELDGFLGETYLSFNKSKHKTSIGYGNNEEYVENLYCIPEENESLADTAARLLILLCEKEIVKFN